MKYLSVCSGVEAASLAWGPLGWQAVAFSEIERFACAVLEQRFPGVPNLGDMTKYREWDLPHFDVLVGGTPCQSYSIAGLREGLNDPRGNLTLVFLGIADRFKPEWIVWENVAGVVSDSTNALQMFLDGLNDIGYAVDIDILDAQCFGVPQRRRRVFVCGHNVRIGRQKKTRLFAATVGQLLTDCLLSVLADLLSQCNIAAPSWASQKRFSSDGLSKRMRLFDLPVSKRKCSSTWILSWQTLLNDWVGAIAKFQTAQSDSDSHSRIQRSEGHTGVADQLLVLETESQFLSTSPSWKMFLEEVYAKAKSSTTSTATQETIDQTIFSCAETSLSICQFICNSTDWQNHCWTQESSGLTALREFMSYARSADQPLFRGLDGVCDWFGFVQSAERTERELARHLDSGSSAAAVLFERSSLRGDPPPCRKKKQDVTGTLAARSSGGGGLGTDVDLDGGLQIAHALRGQSNASHREDSDTYVAHALTARYDSSEDGCGRGLPLVSAARVAGTLGHNAKAAGSATSQDAEAGLLVAYGGNNTSGPIDVATACRAHGGSGHIDFESETFIAFGECERLQGMPDGHTAIKYKGKPAKDGPRYKAIGNSMAVPCMRFIGERIEMVDALRDKK